MKCRRCKSMLTGSVIGFVCPKCDRYSPGRLKKLLSKPTLEDRIDNLEERVSRLERK
jgi:hypothetical protein